MSAASAAGIGRDRQIGRTHFLVDQPGKFALAVLVAGQRGGDLGLLTQGAQRRSLFQVAGLDDDAAIVRRRREHRLERGGNITRACLDQHGAAAAEQRDGVRLLDQPRRIGGKFFALDAHKRERVIGVVDGSAHQRVDALAHQACVWAEHQHDGLSGSGLAMKRSTSEALIAVMDSAAVRER